MEVLAGELICIALAKSTARMRHHRNKKIQLSLRSSGLLAQLVVHQISWQPWQPRHEIQSISAVHLLLVATNNHFIFMTTTGKPAFSGVRTNKKRTLTRVVNVMDQILKPRRGTFRELLSLFECATLLRSSELLRHVLPLAIHIDVLQTKSERVSVIKAPD